MSIFLWQTGKQDVTISDLRRRRRRFRGSRCLSFLKSFRLGIALVVFSTIRETTFSRPFQGGLRGETSGTIWNILRGGTRRNHVGVDGTATSRGVGAGRRILRVAVRVRAQTSGLGLGHISEIVEIAALSSDLVPYSGKKEAIMNDLNNEHEIEEEQRHFQIIVQGSFYFKVLS